MSYYKAYQRNEMFREFVKENSEKAKNFENPDFFDKFKRALGNSCELSRCSSADSFHTAITTVPALSRSSKICSNTVTIGKKQRNLISVPSKKPQVYSNNSIKMSNKPQTAIVDYESLNTKKSQRPILHNISTTKKHQTTVNNDNRSPAKLNRSVRGMKIISSDNIRTISKIDGTETKENTMLTSLRKTISIPPERIQRGQSKDTSFSKSIRKDDDDPQLNKFNVSTYHNIFL